MSGRPIRLVWLRFACWLLATLGALSATATQAQAPADAPAAALTAEAAPASAQALASAQSVYRITRGDELNFRFIYTPELNIVAAVRSDGRLALPLLGDLRVEGLTIAELTERVQQGLAEQVRRPQVVINVQGTGSQRVFVGGEVVRPGVQPLVGPLTVLQAVMAAEGLREGAAPAQVLLLRRGAQGETQPIPVNLAQVMAGAPEARDLPLQPYDVVVVPRSGIANLNLWVDQYIRRALPIALGFSYTINRNGALR